MIEKWTWERKNGDFSMVELRSLSAELALSQTLETKKNFKKEMYRERENKLVDRDWKRKHQL